MENPEKQSGSALLEDSLIEIAREAGALLRDLFSAPRDVDKKGRVDLVTDADRAAEALIQKRLFETFSGASLLLEEGGIQKAPGTGHEAFTFIVDPVDGTTNYAAGIPHFAVSIAAERDKSELCAGVVYDPFRDEMFSASLGQGARLNGRKIEVSQTTALEDSVVATGFPYDRHQKRDNNHAEFEALNLLSRGARRNGAATLDLAWVAAGRFDAYWERGLQPWDAAAGALLVSEAGGTLSSYDRSAFVLRSGEVVATNSQLHEALCDALEQSRREAGFGS